MNEFNPERRRLIQAAGAAALFSALPGAALAAKGGKPVARVVVIGGGFGGATAAKYLRLWSHGAIDVTLIERNKQFISCPASNEVLGGNRAYETLVHNYDGLKKKWGVKVVNASATSVDTEKRRVKTTVGEFAYDRLIVSPGIDFNFDSIQGYDAKAQETVHHAWKAGPQTIALRKQLEAMPDGGVYILNCPTAPYRCPPGPYERISQIAYYFKTHKPKSKVLLLDANDKVISKEKLFREVWANDYKDIIEYRPKWNVVAVDAANRTVTSEVGETERGDVLNLIPQQRGGTIAKDLGVLNVSNRWADVNWITLESTAIPNVHLIGDVTQSAPQMPKSGHMANNHGKAVAAALIEIFAGREPKPTLMANTCYSLVDNLRGIHVASVHRYNPEKKLPIVEEGTSGVYKGPSVEEGVFTRNWASTIWSDVLG